MDNCYSTSCTFIPRCELGHKLMQYSSKLRNVTLFFILLEIMTQTTLLVKASKIWPKNVTSFQSCWQEKQYSTQHLWIYGLWLLSPLMSSLSCHSLSLLVTVVTKTYAINQWVDVILGTVRKTYVTMTLGMKDPTSGCVTHFTDFYLHFEGPFTLLLSIWSWILRSIMLK